MTGVPALREAVAAKIEALYGRKYDAASEITVTAGATQAIITAVLAVVKPGDEVIVLEPCYDSYVPNIELAGGTVVRVPLTPGTFRPDFDKIAAALNAAHPRDPDQLAAQPERHGLDARGDAAAAGPAGAHRRVLISDEVYEHMVFDGRQHQSAARLPRPGRALADRLQLRQDLPRDRLEGRLRGRAGGADGRIPQGAPVQRVHGQHADAARPGQLHGRRRPYLQLPAFYQRKRDLFREGLAATRFKLLPSEGSYFQCVDISGIRSAMNGSRVLQVAHQRDRRGGDSAVGLLRRRLRPARGALLLREEGRDAAGAGAAGEALRRGTAALAETGDRSCGRTRSFRTGSGSSTSPARAPPLPGSSPCSSPSGRSRAQLHFVLAEELFEQFAAQRA
jgi:hypothetical protein